MNLRLPDTVASKQDLLGLIAEVNTFASWFNHETIKKRAGAKSTSKPPVVSQATSELIREYRKKQPLSRGSLASLIADLEAHSRKATNINIVLANVPTPSVKKNLVSWCRNNLSDNILVNFQFNTTLLGGMVVRFGSHVYDWSFRRQILSNRQNIAEAIRNV
jgi:hypothetical protein